MVLLMTLDDLDSTPSRQTGVGDWSLCLLSTSCLGLTISTNWLVCQPASRRLESRAGCQVKCSRRCSVSAVASVQWAVHINTDLSPPHTWPGRRRVKRKTQRHSTLGYALLEHSSGPLLHLTHHLLSNGQKDRSHQAQTWTGKNLYLVKMTTKDKFLNQHTHHVVPHAS